MMQDTPSFQLSSESVAVLPEVSSTPARVRSHFNADHQTADANQSSVVRVLHVVNGQHFSGAERVQAHLARCLPEFGVSVDFSCLLPGAFPDQLNVPTSTVYDTRMKNRFDFAAGKRVAKLAIDGSYNLLHAHTPRSAMIAAVASRISEVPWIYHVHSPAVNDSTRRMQNRVNRWVEEQSLRTVAHQICVSNSLQERTIAYGYDAESVSVVHNGVPIKRPKRDSFPVVGGTWTLGVVALHRPRKGIEYLLQALKANRNAKHEVRLRVIGPFESEDYRKEIDALIKSLDLRDHVEFVGFVDDVPAALAKLDAMVLPSVFGEGLPMVVLEAMATGLPVIATRVEGTPEAIRHDCEGLLAEPADSDSLAHQMHRLMSGEVDWHTLAENATDRHAAEFSDQAMALGVASVYRRVLKQSK